VTLVFRRRTQIFLLTYLLTYKTNEKVLRGDANIALMWSPKFFHPIADPFPGGTGRPKFNQLEMVTTFTYQPSLVRIDARNFELSW